VVRQKGRKAGESTTPVKRVGCAEKAQLAEFTCRLAASQFLKCELQTFLRTTFATFDAFAKSVVLL